MDNEDLTMECPDCGVPMEPGVVPDHTHQFATLPVWQPASKVRPVAKFFRFLWSGFPGRPIKISTQGEVIPITTYRCPDCSLIREYAFDHTNNVPRDN